MIEFILPYLIVLSVFFIVIWLEVSGIICRIIGHKWIATGWESKEISGRLISREVTHKNCERCAAQWKKYND